MRLSDYWADKLAKLTSLAELSMGFQTVDITLKDGTVHRGKLVIDGRDILGSVNFSEDDIADIVISDPLQ